MRGTIGMLVAWSLTAPVVMAQQRGPVALTALRTFGVEQGPTGIAAFSPDGAALALGGPIGDVRVVDFPSCRQRWHATPGDHWSGELVFSPDGARLACCGRHLTIHDANTGEVLLRVEHAGPTGFAWRRDGSGFAYGHGGRLIVRDSEGAAETWGAFEYPINSLDFAPDGAVFVGDNVGRLWRVPPGGGAPALRRDHRTAENDMVRSIRVRFVGDVLFDFASHGNLMRGDERLDAPARCYRLLVAPDGRSFLVSGPERRVRWWTDAGAERRDVDLPEGVAPLAFHPDGESLLAATPSGHQLLRRDRAEPLELPALPSRIQGLGMSPDGLVLAVKAQRWGLYPTSGGPPLPLPQALLVAPGRRGSQFLVWQEDDHIVELEGRSGEELRRRPAPRRPGWGSHLAAGPGELLLVGDALVDERGRTVTELPKHVLMHNWATTARARDGAWAVGGVAGIEGDLGGLVVTDPDGEVRASHGDNPIYALAFSPDGARLFFGCGDGVSIGTGPPSASLRVVDARTLAPLARVAVPVQQWRFLDGRHALASVGQRLQVFSVDRLEPVQELPLGVPCYGFELSEDGRTLALATQRDVRVYRVEYERERR